MEGNEGKLLPEKEDKIFKVLTPYDVEKVSLALESLGGNLFNRNVAELPDCLVFLDAASEPLMDAVLPLIQEIYQTKGKMMAGSFLFEEKIANEIATKIGQEQVKRIMIVDDYISAEEPLILAAGILKEKIPNAVIEGFAFLGARPEGMQNQKNIKKRTKEGGINLLVGSYDDSRDAQAGAVPGRSDKFYSSVGFSYNRVKNGQVGEDADLIIQLKKEMKNIGEEIAMSFVGE
jgi:hypothetical protein